MRNLFYYCLKGLENFINNALRGRNGNDKTLKVRFKVTGDICSDSEMNYIADHEVWNRIIIGDLTLEAIIIGGSGTIKKPFSDVSDLFFVMKRGYIAQNRIQASDYPSIRNSIMA